MVHGLRAVEDDFSDAEVEAVGVENVAGGCRGAEPPADVLDVVSFAPLPARDQILHHAADLVGGDPGDGVGGVRAPTPYPPKGASSL
ncbi:hypothetical protein ABT010_01605 [Streptomyces sp. NPDC002668]|uniref:hypothetical protein n=1 Tax=Streptomyces sp. NPDC002668 TaxID=3154422 RepID=UPI003333933A